jgi:phage gp37-like protein
MASVYPGAVDAFSDPLSNSPLSSPSHSQLHTDVNDALEKIEAYVPRRNLLYNGAMQIHQRGTSVTGITGTNYYTADRWRVDMSSLGTWTQTVENDAPTGSGFRKSLKMVCTTADASPGAGDSLNIQQILEGQDLQVIKKGTSSAEQITFSFWVKANVTGIYIFELYDADNNRQVSKSYTINSSATWEQKTFTIPADTTGALDNDNLASLYVVWWLGAGSSYTSGTLNTSWASAVTANRVVGQVNVAAATNNYWQVTGVQMNVGAVAAPFEFKSYEQDLAECQRYYIKLDNTISANAILASVFFYSTTAAIATLNLPTSMREPVDTVDSLNVQIIDTALAAFTPTVAMSIATSSSVGLTLTVTGATQHRTGWLRTTATSGYLAFNAEL